MADISFLLLSFFLMTSNMDQTSGLQRRLPPMPDTDKPVTPNDDNKVKARNVYQVKINQWDALFAGGRPTDVSTLRQEVKDFIVNAGNTEDKPEKEEVNVPGIGKVMVSKAVISLQNDRGTSYEIYIKVQNELVAAYNELRNEYSFATFGKGYDQLDESQQEAIREVYPQRISEAEPKDISGGKKAAPATTTNRRR